MTRARAAMLAVAGLMLAACGNVHPGAAAVVDGETISMDTLNDTAKVYCLDQLSAAQQQGTAAGAVSNLVVRRTAVTAAVSIIVARKLEKSRGLTINPATYEVPDGDRSAVGKAFPGVDVDTAVKVIEDSREVSAIAVALGAESTGTTPTAENQAQLAEAGQAEIAKAFASNDVSFAPRFGLSGSGSATSDTGTLSASPTDLEAPAAEELPDPQRCS